MNKPRVTLLQKVVRTVTRRPIPEETGEANAQRFVEAVVDQAHEERVIICYPHPGYGGRGGPQHGWIWMLNPRWRDRVLELLAQGAPVREAQFHPPDDLDGWTFSAYSTVPVPRIAQLGLDETI